LHTNPYFELQSRTELQNGKKLCLQGNAKANRISTSFCDNSEQQKWFFDNGGSLRSAPPASLCVGTIKKKIHFVECAKLKKSSRLIYSSDDTLRINGNAIFALRIKPTFTKASRMKKKNSTPLSLAKIKNRAPKPREKWKLVKSKSENPTAIPSLDILPPSTNPTQAPVVVPTSVPSTKEVQYPVPSEALSSVPSMKELELLSVPPSEDRIPPPTRHDAPKFNIALVNMGNITTFDDVFQRAKLRWEELVVGDILDQPKSSNENFDWFANTWPGVTTNIAIDDILIGYSFEEIDGLNGTLGYAGPVYARHEQDGFGETVTVTSLSA